MATKSPGLKSATWLTLVYPESAPDGWIDLLSEVGLPAIISPLHEFDRNPDGELKKPHYHVMLCWDGATTYNNAKRYIDAIGGVGIKVCASKRGSARYWCHLDNPEKYLYDTAGVRTLGGIDYYELINSPADNDITFAEIAEFIDEWEITSFRQLILYARLKGYDSWMKLILRHQRENVLAYLRSAQWEREQIEKGHDFVRAVDVIKAEKAHKAMDGLEDN